MVDRHARARGSTSHGNSGNPAQALLVHPHLSIGLTATREMDFCVAKVSFVSGVEQGKASDPHSDGCWVLTCLRLEEAQARRHERDLRNADIWSPWPSVVSTFPPRSTMATRWVGPKKQQQWAGGVMLQPSVGSENERFSLGCAKLNDLDLLGWV